MSIAVPVAGDPWPPCSAAAANPRQAMSTPRSGQLDGGPRVEGRTRAPASKPAETSWSLCSRGALVADADARKKTGRGWVREELKLARGRARGGAVGSRRWCSRRRGAVGRGGARLVWLSRERERTSRSRVEERAEEVAAGSLGRRAMGWIWAFRVRVWRLPHAAVSSAEE